MIEPIEQIIADETWYSNFGKDKIQEMAEIFHKALFWKCDTIFDCVKLLKGEIIIKPISHIEFSLIINPDKSFKIFRYFPYSSFRDNFTLAHELGHYFVHFLNKYHTEIPKYEVAFKNYSDIPLDTEANWFALAFLMPKKEFLKIAKKCNINEHISLAAHFNVSEKAIELRKKDLGLI